MSIDNPPIYSGITYNSAFFAEDTGGLSEAQANALYLRKTVNDTATALENFSAGLTATTLSASSTSTLNGAVNVNGNAITARDTAVASTSSISLNPAPNSPFVTLTNTTETLSIYTSQATLSSDIQVQSTKKLNIATTTSNVDLNVGTGARNISGVVHHYSDGDNAVAGSGVHLNNGINNFSATNIHNGTGSSGSVNIMSGTGSGGNINIGSGSGSNPTITIGNEVTLNSTNTINGNTTITKPFMDVISATTATSTPSLFNNTTTGNVQIAQNQTGGTFSIGGGLNRDGSISIGQSTKGNILIGSSQQAGTNLITMGTSSLGTVSLRGATVRLNDLGTGATQLSNPSGGAITIYKPLTPNYQSSYSATTGTGSSKIGEILRVGPLSILLNAGTAKSFAFIDLPFGVWLLQGSANSAANYAGYNFLGFSTANNVLQPIGSSNIASAGYDLNINCNWTFSLTTTARYYLVAQSELMGTWNQIYFQAIRIA